MSEDHDARIRALYLDPADCAEDDCDDDAAPSPAAGLRVVAYVTLALCLAVGACSLALMAKASCARTGETLDALEACW